MSHQQLYQAQYRLLDPVPDQLWAGDALLLSFELTNSGAVPWLTFGKHAVRLSYHWWDPQGRTVVHDGLRAALPCPVAPGEQVIVEMRVEAPPEGGQYLLAVDLLEEGVTWFGDQGVTPLQIPVTFRPATAPRICIINGNVVINDAVGNHVVAQLQVLRAAGYQTHIFTEHVDERLPADVRRNIVTLRLRDLQQPDGRLSHAVTHFQTADVVIVNYSTYYELAEAIKLARGVTIFNYHGVTPPNLWDQSAPGYKDLVRAQEQVSLVQHADYAVAHSEYMRAELIQTGLIPSARVSVVPLGPGVEPLPEITRDEEAELRNHHQLAGRQVLLYVGRVSRNKRLIDLVEALPLVQAKHSNAVLLIVGDNESGAYRTYASELAERARELGCQASLVFVGPVPDVRPYYRLCDVFVTASVHEGFCLPVIEAMAHGKPVVASRAAALPETVDRAGLLFEPYNVGQLAEQIVRVLAEPVKTEDIPADELIGAQDEARLREGTIALVPPRYGLEILGGAERHMRGWAEQLVERGYRVEVLTTCTASMADWSNYYTPGVEQINGVTVRRFLSDAVNPEIFHSVLSKANRGEYVRYSDEQRLMQNNLQSSALTTYLRNNADEYLCAIFSPYLFGTTYWGIQALPDKALVLPCLHDEPAARLSIYREMLEGVTGMLPSTQAESDIASSVLGVINRRRTLVGYGFDTHAILADGLAFRTKYNLPEQILLYSGRLERGKNVPLLLEYFTRYKSDHPGELALVLTGQGDVPLPNRPDIIGLGTLPEAELPGAFAAALALCQLSLNESFSIVMMESWLQGRPVIVHADSAVTRSHVEQSGGGFVIEDYPSFRDAVQQLVQDPECVVQLGAAGRSYVVEQYAWPVVIDRLVQGIARFTAPRSVADTLAQRGIQRVLAFTPKRFQDALLDIVEAARAQTGRLGPQQAEQLLGLTQVGAPEYAVRSNLPVVGRLVAWTRRQMTSHLKEPYLDPIVRRQELFNQQVLQTVLPALEQSLRDQRRLQREVENLREQLKRQAPDVSETQNSLSTTTEGTEG